MLFTIFYNFWGRVTGVLAVCAFLALGALSVMPAISSGQVISPAICIAHGGTWNSETSTCNGLSESIICTIYDTLGSSMLENLGVTFPGCGEDGNDNDDDTGGDGDNEGDEEDNTDNGGGSNSEGGSGSGGGGGGGGSSHTAGTGGEVLGTSTGNMCSLLITTYLRLGKQNDLGDTVRLQLFLNEELGLTMPVNGVFSVETHNTVNTFQLKYASEVLAPWLPFGLAENTPTGYVYKTTQRMINNIHCTTLNIPMPQLP